MKVDLPSGATAELRTSLKAKDKFAVQNVVSVASGGEASGGTLALMETALLARLLEAWSLPDELPSRHACPECTGNSKAWHEHVKDAFGEALDIDDWNALEKIFAPLLAKVVDVPNLETSPASAGSSLATVSMPCRCRKACHLIPSQSGSSPGRMASLRR